MKKKIIFLSVLLASLLFTIYPKNVSALDYLITGVDGTIIIRWIDYGDLRNERPESINLVVGERLSSPMQHQTITLNESDATISVDPDNPEITEWKFTKTGFNYFFKHSGDSPFLYEYTEIEDLENLGYNEISSMITGDLHPTKYYLNGQVMEEAGTLVVTLVKNTLTTKNLTVVYNDSNARDNNTRSLDFAITGQNVADPIKYNAYYQFQISPSDTLKENSYTDTYTKSIYISGTDAYQSGNPIINYIFEEDTQNIPGRTITYEINGDNILVTVNYQAKTNIVPMEVVWKDYDNQLGLRPDDISLKAYDQNGNLEKEIYLSKEENWITQETLYENMIYSNGIPINYVMELEPSDDYEYTVSKEGEGYKIIATLKNEEGIIIQDDDLSNDEDEKVIQDDEDKIVIQDENLSNNEKTTSSLIQNNPKTADDIMKYISMFIFSSVSLVFISKSKIQ